MIVLVIVVLGLVSYTSRAREPALLKLDGYAWNSETERLARCLILEKSRLCHRG